MRRYVFAYFLSPFDSISIPSAFPSPVLAATLILLCMHCEGPCEILYQHPHFTSAVALRASPFFMTDYYLPLLVANRADKACTTPLSTPLSTDGAKRALPCLASASGASRFGSRKLDKWAPTFSRLTSPDIVSYMPKTELGENNTYQSSQLVSYHPP